MCVCVRTTQELPQQEPQSADNTLDTTTSTQPADPITTPHGLARAPSVTDPHTGLALLQSYGRSDSGQVSDTRSSPSSQRDRASPSPHAASPQHSPTPQEQQQKQGEGAPQSDGGGDGATGDGSKREGSAGESDGGSREGTPGLLSLTEYKQEAAQAMPIIEKLVSKMHEHVSIMKYPCMKLPSLRWNEE